MVLVVIAVDDTFAMLWNPTVTTPEEALPTIVIPYAESGDVVELLDTETTSPKATPDTVTDVVATLLPMVDHTGESASMVYSVVPQFPSVISPLNVTPEPNVTVLVTLSVLSDVAPVMIREPSATATLDVGLVLKYLADTPELGKRLNPSVPRDQAGLLTSRSPTKDTTTATIAAIRA